MSRCTHFAQTTLAVAPPLAGLQPLRYLHDCSDCFRLERLPDGICTHWKAPPLHGAHPTRTLPPARVASRDQGELGLFRRRRGRMGPRCRAEDVVRGHGGLLVTHLSRSSCPRHGDRDPLAKQVIPFWEAV